MTIQEHYNKIQIGKGDKSIFLKNIKELYPHLIPNAMGFDNAVVILKQKSILNEAYKEPISKKEEGFETKFKSFLAEVKKEKEIKADLKKTDKSVLDKQVTANFTNKNSEFYKSTGEIKNADNVIHDQYMRGIYTEMSLDPTANLNKVKETVLKNLTKDPLFYLKNGQFGIKGLGYTDELPGAKVSKDDRTVVLDKSKVKSNVKDNLGKKESFKSDPKKVKTMSTSSKKSKGVKKTPEPTKGKIIKLKENQSLESLFEESEFSQSGMHGEDDFINGILSSIYEKFEDLIKNENWGELTKKIASKYTFLNAEQVVDDIKEIEKGENLSEGEETESSLEDMKARIIEWYELAEEGNEGEVDNSEYKKWLEVYLNNCKIITKKDFKKIWSKYLEDNSSGDVGADWDTFKETWEWVESGDDSVFNENLSEGPESQDDSQYIKRLASDLVNNVAFAGETEFENSPEKLIAAYGPDDIKEFYKEIFGKLPLGDPSQFSVNESEDISKKPWLVTKKTYKNYLDEIAELLAKEDRFAEEHNIKKLSAGAREEWIKHNIKPKDLYENFLEWFGEIDYDPYGGEDDLFENKDSQHFIYDEARRITNQFTENKISYNDAITELENYIRVYKEAKADGETEIVGDSIDSIIKDYESALSSVKNSKPKSIKETWEESLLKMAEGALEDNDAKLAKDAADAESKEADIEKQRADNKAKIAAANKNI